MGGGSALTAVRLEPRESLRIVLKSGQLDDDLIVLGLGVDQRL